MDETTETEVKEEKTDKLIYMDIFAAKMISMNLIEST